MSRLTEDDIMCCGQKMYFNFERKPGQAPFPFSFEVGNPIFRCKICKKAILLERENDRLVDFED